MEIAGYQSDIKTTTIFNEDKYHAEKSIAEFGVTTGSQQNVYELTLNPKLTKPYEKGLRLQVVFHRSNTGAITLNVDGKGAVQVFKLNALCPTTDDEGDIPIEGDFADRISLPSLNESSTNSAREREGLLLEPLKAGDIVLGVHYILVFDGERFQMINHIPECAPSANTTNPPQNGSGLVDQRIFTIQGRRIGTGITPVGQRYRIAAVNGNFIVPRDIRVKKVGDVGILTNAFVRLPISIDTYLENTTVALQSIQGNNFYGTIGRTGIMEIHGETKSEDEEIIVTFPPYMAKFPLEWDDVTGFETTLAPKPTVKKTRASKATRTTKTKKN